MYNQEDHMKNKIFLAGVSLVILVSLAFLNTAEEKKQEVRKPKKNRCILCTGITQETLKGVKASKRKTPTGAVVVMTSPDPKVVQKIRGIIDECRKKSPEERKKREILSMPGATTTITQLNNGIRIEISSTDATVAAKIKRLRLPNMPRRRSVNDL